MTITTTMVASTTKSTAAASISSLVGRIGQKDTWDAARSRGGAIA